MTRILQVSTNPMLQNTVKTKCKVPDDETTGAETMSTANNPLVNAAKKAKREAKTGASNKRKLANAEEQPGGLLIVRAPSVPPSAPPTTATTTSTKPPSKKFKSSQPLPSTSKPPSKSKPKSTSSLLLPSSQPLPHPRHNTPDADPALDDAVRAMQDEAAHLRRTSRGPIHDTPSTSSSTSTGLNPKFQFPSAAVAGDDATENTGTGAGVGVGAGTGKSKRRETIVDTSARLPPEGDETPLIQRNKRLRAGAMAAIGAGMSAGGGASAAGVDAGPDVMTPPGAGAGAGAGRSSSGASGSGHRRKSSVGGRGKRISSSFESTGVITQPHPTVADTSFFKHIDADLPDAQRVRQLLIWCSARAASSPSSSSSSAATSGPSTSSTKDPPAPPLPTLSAKAAQALKATQDDVVRKLADRRVDLSLFGGSSALEPAAGPGGGGGAEDGVGEKKANAQNITNRVWEGVYGGHIRSAMEEEEAWKKVSYVYDTYAKRLRTSLDKRRAALAATTTTSTSISPDGPSTPSAKAQGKQRAHAPTNTLELREQELPAPFQAGVRMARTVFAQSRARRRSDAPLPSTSAATPGAGPSTSTGTRKGADPDSRPLPTGSHSYSYDMEVDVEQETEKEVEKERALIADFRTRMGEVEFKIDHLYVLASQAKAAAEVAELMLDRRFEMLGRALDARDALGSGGVEGGGILGRYVRGTNPSDGGVGIRGGGEKADEALRLLRALARVDAARPPALVGDAARRAVREAQRVGESGGVGVVGERKLTGVPSAGPGVTPRKMPGTPRRGTTPSRERER